MMRLFAVICLAVPIAACNGTSRLDIRSDGPRRLAFRMRAAAIRDGATVAVATTDRGRTWTASLE